MGIDQTTLDAQRCWNWISGRTSFTRSELTLAMRHVMKAADLTAALTLLAERHLIDTAEGTPTPRSRLKTHTVNPLTVTPKWAGERCSPQLHPGKNGNMGKLTTVALPISLPILPDVLRKRLLGNMSLLQCLSITQTSTTQLPWTAKTPIR